MDIETIYSSNSSLENPFQLNNSQLSSRLLIPLQLFESPTPKVEKISLQQFSLSINSNNDGNNLCVYKKIRVKLEYWPITNLLQNLLQTNLEAYYCSTFLSSFTQQQTWKAISLDNLSTVNLPSNPQGNTRKEEKKNDSPQKKNLLALKNYPASFHETQNSHQNNFDYHNIKTSNESPNQKNKFASKL